MHDTGGLCGALFDTPDGTGVCEAFGPHERHGGVVMVGRFICHKCRGVPAGTRKHYYDRDCHCKEYENG